MGVVVGADVGVSVVAVFMVVLMSVYIGVGDDAGIFLVSVCVGVGGGVSLGADFDANADVKCLPVFSWYAGVYIQM